MVFHTPRERKPTQFLEFACLDSFKVYVLPRKVRKPTKVKDAKPVKVAKTSAARKKTTKVAKKAPKRVAKKVPLPSARILNVVPSALVRTNSKSGSQVGTLERGNSSAFKWQFWDDGNKWADYDLAASKVLERAYADWMKNPHIDVRSVKSGYFNYMVDFNMMQQQNVSDPKHRIRKIQRVTAAGFNAVSQAVSA